MTALVTEAHIRQRLDGTFTRIDGGRLIVPPDFIPSHEGRRPAERCRVAPCDRTRRAAIRHFAAQAPASVGRIMLHIGGTRWP